MSRAGWAYLHSAYADAWETRLRTGDHSVELLIDALRRQSPPPDVPDPYEPGSVVRELWSRGVEPERLRRELYMSVPGLAKRGIVEPVRAVLEALRPERPR